MTVVQNPYITKRKVITNTNGIGGIGIGNNNNNNTLIPTASTTKTTTSLASSSLASSLLDIPRNDVLPSVQDQGVKNDTAINTDIDTDCNNVDANNSNANNTTSRDQQQQPQQHQQKGQELQVQRDETNPLHDNENIGLPLPASTTTTTTTTSTGNEMIASSSSFAISSLLSSSSSVTNRTSSTDLHYGQRLPSQTIPLVSAEIVTIPEIYTNIIPKLQQQQHDNTNQSLEYQRPKSIRITGIILHYHHHTTTNNNNSSNNNNNFDNIISLIVGNPLVVGVRLPPTPITIDNYKTIYSSHTNGTHIDSVTSNQTTKNSTTTKKPILSSINRLKTPLTSTMKRRYPSSSSTNTNTTTTTIASKKSSSSQRVSFAPVLTSNTATSTTITTTTPRTASIPPNNSINTVSSTTMMKTTTVKKKPILVYQKKVSTNKLLLSTSTTKSSLSVLADSSSSRRLSFAPTTSTMSSTSQSRNTNDNTDDVKNDTSQVEVVDQQLLSYKRLVCMIYESTVNKDWIWIQINPSCTNIIGTIHTNDLITVFGELILPISNNTNHNNNDDDTLQHQSIETNGNEIEQTNSIVHTDVVDENRSNAEALSTMSQNNDIVCGDFNETRSNNALVDTDTTNRDHNLPTIERPYYTTTAEDEIDNDHTMKQTIKSCCCYIKARIVRNTNGTNMKHYTEALYKRRQCLPSIQSSTS